MQAWGTLAMKGGWHRMTQIPAHLIALAERLNEALLAAAKRRAVSRDSQTGQMSSPSPDRAREHLAQDEPQGLRG